MLSLEANRHYRRVRKFFRNNAKNAIARSYTRHLSGPRKFDLEPNDVCGVLLGRNISFFIPEFMKHYRALGMDYLVYLDNGSDDDSVAQMSSYDRVIVLSNTLNFRSYQPQLRSQVANLYASGGWRLAVDADEILRYPGDRHIDLKDLVLRLEKRGQTGLLAQMLEMVPDGPLETVDGMTFAEARRKFLHYSLNDISAYPYHSEKVPLHGMLARNRAEEQSLSFMYGGLRRTLFTEDCCLSKHVLYKPGPGVVPLMNPHVTVGLNIADFTAVLQHYKFAGGFLQRERRRQREGRIRHNETDLRLATLARSPEMTLTVPGMRSDPTPERLLREGFLTATEHSRRVLDIQPALAGS